MKSAMQHLFSMVPKADIQRAVFNRSHGYKTTFDAGQLIPVYVDEALPGDTFTCNMTAFARLATPIHPIFDNMMMDSFFFAVPIRLIWDHWQQFNGEQKNPGDTTDYLVPQMVSPVGGYVVGSLSDYFGIPTQVANLSHSSLWHRAYNLIWNEWFRDENLQDSVVVDTDDGPDAPTDYVVLRRGKRHDYFTSSLPWPQKGPSVALPLGTQAPVKSAMPFDNTAGNSNVLSVISAGDGLKHQIYSNGSAVYGHTVTNASFNNLYTDLSSATAATINQLRQAFQIQKLYERDARGGTRYTEIIRSHFGVVSPDARLQRPEYLGGGSSPVNVAPVAQTSETSGTSPQANLAAVGTVTANRHGFTKSFTEHCVLIGMVCVRADLNYQQGLNRMFARKTRWDYYWPALAHIGEQAVLRQEIYATGVPANDTVVFGYQERFAEYRYKPSNITGMFRSTFAQTLDSWHLAQNFSSAPVLNSAFIQEDPPVDRVIAVPSQPHFMFDSHFDLKSARPMPVYGVPGLIDHF